MKRKGPCFICLVFVVLFAGVWILAYLGTNNQQTIDSGYGISEAICGEVVEKEIASLEAAEASEMQEIEEENTPRIEYIDGTLFYDLDLGITIEDSQMLRNAQNLLVAEADFFEEVYCLWHASKDELYDIGGHLYLLVDEEGIDDWSYFEDKARQIYDDYYIEHDFTGLNFGAGKLYCEYEGNLYRAMADGIKNGFDEESLRMWKISEGTYLLGGLKESIEGAYIWMWVVRDNIEKPYNLEILSSFQMYG